MISNAKVPPLSLACMYNLVDCTVNISDAEGFGLSTLESLSCGTPIIVTMTGGLQEQVTDREEWFGIGIEPVSKAIIGSQDIPYIYEDRIKKEDFLDALTELYNLTKQERNEMGMRGRNYVERKYSFKNYTESWDRILKDVHERHGSWETRKEYKNWHLLEV